MKYKKLGNTSIEVSSICLGSMNWGAQNTEAEGHTQLNMAIDSGINFIDTAEMYPIPPVEATYGRTEEIIGTWLAGRKDRDKLIIATKIAPPGKNRPWIRGTDNKLDKKNLQQAVDDSLKRLQTDYIDLYQVHWPERYTNYFGQLNYTHNPDRDGTPIEESLEALDDVVKSGKVRFIGVSNETPWGVAEYLRVSREKSLTRIVSIQNPYNLLNRTFEIGISEIAIREKVGLLAYSPLGFGVLSGKYLNDLKPEGSRLTDNPSYKRYMNDNGIRMTGKYVELAHEFGLEPAQMALAFILTRPFITSIIISASRPDQLKTDIECVDLELPEEVVKKIESLHFQQPNPCP
jgi:aryl-alcohol dehydrogenase-like predicted oxidoreductase